MSDLTRVTTSERIADDTFEALVPPGWSQGRGAFGGLVVGLLMRAMEAFEQAPDRLLRSLSAELCGPLLVGPAQIKVERLRSGTGASIVAARILQEDAVQAHAVGVFGRTRNDDAPVFSHPAPTLERWEDIDVLPIAAPFGPEFAQHFEFRPTSAPPFSGVEGITSGWVKAKVPGAKRDAAALAMLADAYWPAVLASFPAPRPTATIAYSLQVIGSLATLAKDEPVFHRARTSAVVDGYAMEVRELWSADGRLLALNPQTFAVLG